MRRASTATRRSPTRGRATTTCPKDLQNPAPWQWNYDDSSTGGSRVGGDRQRHRPHPAPAVLPAHGQPGRDRQVGELTRSRSAACSTTVFRNLGHDQNLKHERARTRWRSRSAGSTRPRSRCRRCPTLPDPADRNRVIAKFPDAGGLIALLGEVHAQADEAAGSPARRGQGEGAGRQRLGREGRRRATRSTRSPPPDSVRRGRPRTPTAATTTPRSVTRPASSARATRSPSRSAR